MHTFSTCLKNWWLKLSAAKSLCLTFHLYNKEECKKLNIKVNNNKLYFQTSPIYLSNLSIYRQHLKTLSAKTAVHVAFTTPCLYNLGCFYQGASHHHLGIFAAEYCTSVWCRISHIKKLDTILNNPLCTISGYLQRCSITSGPCHNY